MKLARTTVAAALFAATLSASAASPAAGAVDDDGWQAFGHALTLAQMLVGIAARSDNPQASQKALDDVLAGRNTEANRAIAGMLQEATAEMPAQYRDQVLAIGRDLTQLARRNAANAPAGGAVSADRAPEAALRARKDLTAIGLTYHDSRQFLDAVKRDDALAVELYIAARGVNLDARDASGRTALDIARSRGNAAIESLLARARS